MAENPRAVTMANKKDLLGDIRRQNNFVVSITGVTTTGDNNLQLIIDRAFLPRVSNQVLELRHGNDSIKLAGVASWEGGEISFHDVLSEDELNAVMRWRAKVYDTKTGKIGLASEYKKSGTVTELGPNGEYKRVWNLRGMWISALDPGTLDSSSGELKKVTMTIQIDPTDDANLVTY